MKSISRNLLFSATLHLLLVLTGARPLVADEELRGSVEAIYPGEIIVRTTDTTEVLKIQGKHDRTVTVNVDGKTMIYNSPAKVSVSGSIPVEKVAKGRQVKVVARMNRLARIEGDVAELWLVSLDDSVPGITVVKEAEESGGFAQCEIVGAVDSLRNNRLLVDVPKNDYVRAKKISVPLADGAMVQIASDDYERAGPGSRVTRAVVRRYPSGDLLVREIEIEVDAESLADNSADEELLLKYRHLPDEPLRPRDIRSQHFLLKTDVSERQAAIILEKLEHLVSQLEAYFGRRLGTVVVGFIVRDLDQWPAGSFSSETGLAMMRRGGGLCHRETVRGRQIATLYCVDRHGTIQHEATHAFCGLVFGDTGPTWLAEGIADLGKYWKDGERAVAIKASVIRYLKTSEPKRTLGEIAVPGKVPALEADWKDYSWRWVLCHLLANNPNYASRFKPMAMAIMSEKPVSFQSVYGPVAPQVSFEYDFFLEHFDNGYRADLCAWQWNKKSRTLPRGGRQKLEVKADYGWQASGVQVFAGTRYDVAALGGWKTASGGEETTAAGADDGRGRLVATVMNGQYELSDEIELGPRSTFEAPTSGNLYFRCRDDWHRLSDNAGELTVHIRQTPTAPGKQ
jgi:hypothetical protein